MFFGGLFSKRQRASDLVLVLDIGSSSIGGALCHRNKREVPEIIFSVREPIALKVRLDSDGLLNSAMKALAVVIDKVCLSGLGAPEKIFCILSSPWYVSEVRSIKLRKNVPFVVSTKLIDGLLDREIALFKDEHMVKYGSGIDGVRAVELRITKTMLNGYSIDNPLEQRAEELEMTIFISIAGERILQNIEQVVGKHFGGTIKFSSFTIVSFAVVKSLFTRDDFVLLDIGGEVTDICMVKNGMVRDSASFPLGANFVVRELHFSLNISLAEASSLFILYQSGHAEDKIVNSLKLALSKICAIWLSELEKSLFSMSRDISVPDVVFVAVDSGFESFFRTAIQAEQFSQYSLTDSKFKVIPLSLQALYDTVSYREGVERDIFVSIEASYINHFLG